MSKVSPIILSDIETISENEIISDNESFELLDEQVFFYYYYFLLILNK